MEKSKGRRAGIAVAAVLVAAAGAGVEQARGQASQPATQPGIHLPPVPEDRVPPEIYQARRERLLARIPRGVILLYGARDEGLDRFAQDDDFFYLSGVDAPGAALLLTKGLSTTKDGERDLLFLPPRDAGKEKWTGPVLHPGENEEEKREVRARTGFREVLPAGELPAVLRKCLGLFPEGEAVLYYPYAPVPLERPLDRALRWVRDFRERFPDTAVRSVLPPLHDLRRVKGPDEIAILERAIAITGEAQRRAARALRPGMREYELQAVIEATFRERGAEPGFPSIVGSGRYSTVLHYNANERKMREGDLVVCDIGAKTAHYTADVTRTWPVGGRFTRRQREIYETVLRAQEAAFAAIRPGATIQEVHEEAKKVIEAAGFKDYFIHGTSHFLGMDVHDPGDREKPLEPGCVITVEPGVYLADEEIGVRIEDDVLVTPGGRRILTEGIPRTVEEVEAARARRDSR